MWPFRKSPPSELDVLRRRVAQVEQEWEETQRRITNALRSLRMREQALYGKLEENGGRGRGGSAGGGGVRALGGILGGRK